MFTGCSCTNVEDLESEREEIIYFDEFSFSFCEWRHAFLIPGTFLPLSESSAEGSYICFFLPSNIRIAGSFLCDIDVAYRTMEWVGNLGVSSSMWWWLLQTSQLSIRQSAHLGKAVGIQKSAYQVFLFMRESMFESTQCYELLTLAYHRHYNTRTDMLAFKKVNYFKEHSVYYHGCLKEFLELTKWRGSEVSQLQDPFSI